MSFDRLGDILGLLKARYPAFSKRLREADALTYWEKTVGPQIARHARAIRVDDGVLWVEVDHPIWKSELHHRKRQILDALNGAITLGAQSVKTSAPEKPPPILKDLLLLEPRNESAPKRPTFSSPLKPTVRR